MGRLLPDVCLCASAHRWCAEIFSVSQIAARATGHGDFANMDTPIACTTARLARAPLRWLRHDRLMRLTTALSGLLGAGLILVSVGCDRSPAAVPPSSPSATPATAAPVSPDPLVGPVFLGASDLHTCTGSVL